MLFDVNRGNSCIWLHLLTQFQSRQKIKGQSYPVEYCLELVEEYSEYTIHKGEPEPRKGNVNTVYFINQARANTRISRTEFTMKACDCKWFNTYIWASCLE